MQIFFWRIFSQILTGKIPKQGNLWQHHPTLSQTLSQDQATRVMVRKRDGPEEGRLRPFRAGIFKRTMDVTNACCNSLRITFRGGQQHITLPKHGVNSYRNTCSSRNRGWIRGYKEFLKQEQVKTFGYHYIGNTNR